VFAILPAITDEFHQGFVAGRHESALGVRIDASAALTAVVGAAIVRTRRA
jgi:VanZ family protein